MAGMAAFFSFIFCVFVEKTVVNSSFARPLSEHLNSTERTIASPIETCVLFLLEYGLKEEVPRAMLLVL